MGNRCSFLKISSILSNLIRLKIFYFYFYFSARQSGVIFYSNSISWNSEDKHLESGENVFEVNLKEANKIITEIYEKEYVEGQP